MTKELQGYLEILQENMMNLFWAANDGEAIKGGLN